MDAMSVDTDRDRERDRDDPAAPPTLPSSPPQVRSRITVVCAECKRLKLKCDRRTPCASCVKRDTVVRCVYSPAAAEKVDLHSLNNRLIAVEALLAQYQDAPPPPAAPSQAQAQAQTQTQAHPQPPAQPRTAPLSTPLPALHAAFLAPLGAPCPSFAPPPRVRVKTEHLSAFPASAFPSTSSSSAPGGPGPLAATPALLALLPPPAALPARLAAAHAALSALGAAPFAFPAFEARVYAFISALSSPAPASPSPAAAARDAEKEARRHQRALKRQRAARIFSGGAHPLPAPLLPPHPNGTISANQSDSEPDEPPLQQRQQRGDPRIAFFVLLCAVFALDAGAGEADDSRLALRAAEEYFAGATPAPSSASDAEGDGEAARQKQMQADTDAVLALWVVGVRMLRAAGGEGGGGEGMEGVYVHFAKAVAHARVVGADLPSGSSYPGPQNSTYQPQQPHASTSALYPTSGQGQGHVPGQIPGQQQALGQQPGGQGHGQHGQGGQGTLRRRRAVVKTEEGEGGAGEVGDEDGGGREGRERERERRGEAEAVRRRAWWAVVWGDMLVADALGLPPAFGAYAPLPQQSQHPQQPPQQHTQGNEEEEALDGGRDWGEEGESGDGCHANGAGGRRFGAGVRLAKVLATLPPGGAEAEGAVRAWEAREIARVGEAGSRGSNSPWEVDGDGARERDRESGMGMGERGDDRERERERGRERERAEIRLVAGRAVLRAWVGSDFTSAKASPNPSLQALYGAVGAAHGIVQACGALAACDAEARAAVQAEGLYAAQGYPPTPAATTSTSLAPPTSLALLASPPARALFDAGAVCAYAALRHPGAVFAPGARIALEGAVSLLREGWGGPAAGCSPSAQHRSMAPAAAPAWSGRGEALRVLDGLLAGLRGSEGPARMVDGGSAVAKINDLKRKHEHGEGEVGAGVLEMKEREMLLGAGAGKEKDGGKDKKKRGYPTVGIRVRPGKEALGGIIGGAMRRVSKDAAYFQQGPPPPQRQEQTQTHAQRQEHVLPPIQHHHQQQQQQPQPHQQQQHMPEFRSRSSSISQHELAMDYGAYPPQGYDAPPPQAYEPPQPQYADPAHQQRPQQGYAGDAASTALYERAGFELPRTESFDSGSPYGTAASPFSAASSPYTTTSNGASTAASASGGLTTPTFGNGNGNTPSVNGSPPAFGAQNASPGAPFGGPQGTGAGAGVNANASPPAYPFYGAYDGGGYEPQGMALDPGAPVYEVKPMLEPHHHHGHAHGHHNGAYHLEAEAPRHEMAWAEPPQHAAPYWGGGEEYKYYAQA